MTVDDTAYFEHFGIKGMKWGVHRTGERRSAGKKAASAAGGAAAGILATKFVAGSTMNVKLALISGAAATVAGAKFVQSMQDDKIARGDG